MNKLSLFLLPGIALLSGIVCINMALAAEVNPNPGVSRAEISASKKREKLPVGSNRTDPVLRKARVDARTAQREWKEALNAYLQQVEEAAQGNFTLTDEREAEAAFISANFEEFVALRRLQLENIHQIRQWHRERLAVTPGIPELYGDVLPVAWSRNNSKAERLDAEAYLSAGTTLLVQEGRVEVARAEAAREANEEK